MPNQNLPHPMPSDPRDNIEPPKNAKENAYYVIEDVVGYIP